MGRLMQYINRRIGFRLTLIITLSIVGIMSVFLIFEISNSIKAANQQLSQKMDTMEAIAQNALSEALWSFDEPGAKAIADSLLKDKDIKSIRIYTSNDEILYMNGEQASMKASGDDLVRSVVIRKQDAEVGSVVLEFTKEGIESSIREKAFLRLLQIVFVALILIIILVFAASRIIKPIKRLSDEAEWIASGELHRRVKVESGDEIGVLAQKFNEMLESLGKAHAEILNYSEKLELLVRERTADYDRANYDLVEKNKELENALQLIQKTQSQLIETEKMAALGSIVARVAHELNTPLGNSISASSFLKRSNETNKQKLGEGTLSKGGFIGFMEDIDFAVDQLDLNLGRTAELVNNFKKLAVDFGSDVKSTFDLRIYIETVIIGLRDELEERDHQIYNCCPENTTITSYPAEFAQIFSGLIRNSMEHGFKDRTGGHIDISARIHNGVLRIDYQDDGTGIREEDLEQIFHPFFTTARHSGKSGLGLNIIYNIVTQKLKGSIRCESKLGHGTAFIMEMPVVL